MFAFPADELQKKNMEITISFGRQAKNLGFDTRMAINKGKLFALKYQLRKVGCRCVFLKLEVVCWKLSIIGMGSVSKATMVDSFFFVNCYTSEISWRGVTSGCFSQVLEVFPPSLVDDNTLILFLL